MRPLSSTARRGSIMLAARRPSDLALLVAIALAAAASGCGAPAPPIISAPSAISQSVTMAPDSLPTRALITFDSANQELAYFKISRKGSEALLPLSHSLGLTSVYALAADGNVVIASNYSPAEVVTYDLKTRVQKKLSDPYGGPLDVAVGKSGTIYALNPGSVAVFKPSSSPSELRCSQIDTGEAIAVNNEGDVFVDGYGQQFQGVVEYPNGSTKCIVPHLRASRGYIAGVGVDPKTDDLIVVDDPDLCAGGLEGRMVIYPRPYEQRTSVRRVLATTYCAGIFRLDAGSTHIFYSDATVSAGEPIIDQARYPSGQYEGQYWQGYFGSGAFTGFTTIPNQLPN